MVASIIFGICNIQWHDKHLLWNAIYVHKHKNFCQNVVFDRKKTSLYIFRISSIIFVQWFIQRTSQIKLHVIKLCSLSFSLFFHRIPLCKLCITCAHVSIHIEQFINITYHFISSLPKLSNLCSVPFYWLKK